MYGNAIVQTPHLESFARQSTVFDRAITTAPVCTPYRGCLLTGRYPSQTGVLENGQALPQDATTFAHLLNESGYETYYIGKWHLSGDPQANRWVAPEQRGGFQHFIGWESHHVDHNAGLIWENNPDKAIQLTGHETDGLTDIAIQQLNKASASNKPFCMIVSYQAPHAPCSAPEAYNRRYDELDLLPEPNADKSAWYKRPGWNADYDVETFRRLYFGEISHIDAAFGRLLSTLDELNLTDNTLVIFTSDHGEMAGAHGLFGKGVMYEEALHVPLIVRLPKQKEVRRSTFTASTIDFLPTLLDYAGCIVYDAAEGVSLRPYLEGNDKSVETIAISEYHNFCASNTHWKLFTEGRTLNKKALYNIDDDLYELQNRLDDPACAAIQQTLFQEITDWYDSKIGEIQS